MTYAVLSVSVLVLVTAASARRAVVTRHRMQAQRLVAPAIVDPTTPPARVPHWLRRRLDAADVAVPRREVLQRGAVALVTTVTLAAVLAGPGLAAVAGAVMCGGPMLALRLLGGRRDERIEAALPPALEALARALRTGGSLRQAIAETAAVTPGALGVDLGATASMIERGMAIPAALDEWVASRPLACVRLAAAALALGAETGGAQAHAIDGVAATLRDRIATAAELHAQATQARVSAAVIALAPIAFCFLASTTDARTATLLFRTPVGLVLLAAGLGLDALGAVWMARLTRAPQ